MIKSRRFETMLMTMQITVILPHKNVRGMEVLRKTKALINLRVLVRGVRF